MKNKTLTGGFGIGNIIFIAALILALPLRIYQYLGGVIEPATGFFAKNDFSIYALYGVIILAAVAVIVLGIINRKKLAYEIAAQKNPVLGIASVLIALGIILDVAFSMDIPGALEAIKAAKSAEAAPVSTEITAHYVLIIQAVFSLPTALFFTVLGINSLMGKNLASELRILSLSPVIWAMLRMVARFMRTISYTRVSELLFEMFMLALMIMFFMNFAQCNAKVNDKDCAWKIASYGLPAALLALVCFVPRAILLVLGKGELLYAESALEFSDLTVAIFIISAVLTKITTKTSASEADADESNDE